MIKTKKFALLIIMCITLFTVLAFAQDSEVKSKTYVLTWDPSPSTDLAYYEVHWGTESGVYTEHSGDIGLVTTWTMPPLDESRTYYVAVTVYDLAGLQSDYSNEVTTRPIPPGNVKKSVQVDVSVTIMETN